MDLYTVGQPSIFFCSDFFCPVHIIISLTLDLTFCHIWRPNGGLFEPLEAPLLRAWVSKLWCIRTQATGCQPSQDLHLWTGNSQTLISRAELVWRLNKLLQTDTLLCKLRLERQLRTDRLTYPGVGQLLLRGTTGEAANNKSKNHSFFVVIICSRESPWQSSVDRLKLVVLMVARTYSRYLNSFSHRWHNDLAGFPSLDASLAVALRLAGFARISKSCLLPFNSQWKQDQLIFWLLYTTAQLAEIRGSKCTNQ